MPDIKLFAGNATPELAKKISERLYISLGDATVGRFSDGEIQVQINENVRGADVFIIQSTCAPTNDNLMELIVMVDALRRASAGRITAVVPYFGYARQDRRVRSARVPITAKVVADLLSTVGIDRVLTCDLHAEQIQGFFDVPVDNVFGSPVLLDDILKKTDLVNPIVVSPDIGGVVLLHQRIRRELRKQIRVLHRVLLMLQLLYIMYHLYQSYHLQGYNHDLLHPR